MRARAPASSANLGPGFDTLAVALRVLRQRRGRGGPLAPCPQRGRGSRSLRRRLAPGGPCRRRGPRSRPLRRDRALADPRRPRPGLLRRAGRGGRRRRRRRGPVRRRRRPMTGTPRTQPPARSAGSSPPPWWRPARCRPPLPLSEELAFVVVVPERNLATPEARGVLPDASVAGRRRLQPRPHGPAGGRSGRPRRARPRGDRRPRPPAGPHRAVPRSAAASWRPSSRPGPWRPAGPAPGLPSSPWCGRMQPRRCSPGPRPRWPPAGVPGRAMVLQPDRRGIVYGDEAAVSL